MNSATPLILILIGLFSAPLLAIDEQHVRDKARTVYGLYLTPYQAFNMKQAQGDDVLFIDVRSRAELKFSGASPLIDANIPARFMHPDFDWSDYSDTYRTIKNEHFVADVEQLLNNTGHDKSTPIILMCTSGSKVPKAAALLHEAGFKTVFSQYQGFSGIKARSGLNEGQRRVQGWVNSGLPWSYRLNKSAMYFNFDSSSPQAKD